MSNDGGLNKMRAEWRLVREAWRVERAEQSGWTHEVAQRVRTLCRKGPVIAAHLIMTLAGALVIALVGLWLWCVLTIKH